jgi:Spy/CpxP family protein refolding chaperone
MKRDIWRFEMRKQTIFAGMIVALFLLALSASFAQNPPERPGERLANFLNLTPEQKTKLEGMRKARQEERQAIFEQMRRLRTELREAMKNPQSDEKKIDGLIDEMSRLRATQMKNGLRAAREMEKVLTPEQLKKFNEARARMGWRQGFGPGFGPRPWGRRGWGPGPFSRFGMRHRLMNRWLWGW